MRRWGRKQMRDRYDAVRRKTLTVKNRNGSNNSNTVPLNKPLRIFQFIATLMLFAFSIYMMTKENSPMPDVVAILLILLSALYLFIMAVDIISQFGGEALPETPMFLFSVLGVIFFTIAAILVYFYILKKNSKWDALAVGILCVIVAILFLIDIMLVLMYWRHKFTTMKKCCPYVAHVENACGQDGVTTLFARNDPLSIKSEKQMTVCNITTSISDYQRPLTEEDTCHVYRKIGFGNRREYVDCPTNSPSITVVEVAEVQTEMEKPKEVKHAEALTVREVTEKPVRSRTKCATYENAVIPGQCPVHCGVCPTFLHLVRGFNTCTCGLTQPQGQQRTFTDASTSGLSTSETKMTADRKGGQE